MSEPKRLVISNAVKRDLRGWLLHNFEFKSVYEKRMALWPQSLREETGFGIGTALFYENWKLEIVFPENPEPSGKPTKHTQSVQGQGDTNGGYSVTKTHTWSW